MNPLTPTPFDGTMMVVAVVAFVFAVVALISIIISAAGLPGWRLITWSLIVLFVPFVGPAAWLASRRRARSWNSEGGTPRHGHPDR